jgi:hypothetical protein
MVTSPRAFRAGDRVTVPWGFEEVVGEVVEVWGDPVAHVRVALQLEEGEPPEVLLLNPDVVTPLAPA